MSKPSIRPAKREDVKAIYGARSRSIMELCGKDYSEEQLKAWAFKDYNEADIDGFIIESSTWVVCLNDQVEGVAQLMNDGEVKLLYLTKMVSGQKLGKQLMEKMEVRAKKLGLKKLRLRSSRTAHAFYKSCGFVDISPEKLADIRGAQVPCIDMEKLIGEF